MLVTKVPQIEVFGDFQTFEKAYHMVKTSIPHDQKVDGDVIC